MIDQVDEVKNKVDIVEVISSYIPLKKMGRNLGGLCPFHGEKTPSFMVSPERQSFKCFGCSEGGDVFTFLEKIEGWDFRETLEELAKRAGVKLADQKVSRGSKVREKLIEINNLTAKFYSHILDNHPSGKVARDYLANRGIDETLWKKFGLGYSPDGWENTFNFLKKHGFGIPDIALSGLVVGREGNRGSTTSFYDRFRGRIMFPIKDSRGTILGFSGRVLEKDVKEAKYINSPETPIFYKGSLLFGLDVARSAIRDKNETVLVEGEFDVISAHKAGVVNTVASKGTALTEKQVATIARLSENVSLCFDMDLAGDAASRRGIELLDMAGLTIKVVRITGGKDPDELAQKDPKGFEKAISEAVNVYDYLIDSACSRFDVKTADGKKKIGKEVLPVIAKITDDLVRAHFETKLAKILDLDVTLINEAVVKRQEVGGVPEANIEVVADAEVNVLEDYFLALFLAGDSVYSKVVSRLEAADFESEQSREFWKTIRAIISDSKLRKPSAILAELPEKFAEFVDHLYFVNISPSVLEKESWVEEILKVADRIHKRALLRKMKAISSELKVAQQEGNETKMETLSKEFDAVSRLLEVEEN